MHLPDGFEQFRTAERVRESFDVAITLGVEHIHGGGVDSFEKEETDPLFGERELLHGHRPE